MAAEYCRVKKKILFRRSSTARNSQNWDLHLEQKNTLFPNVYKIAQ